eukprot:scaffold14461_cov250-Ochromonas_danica.AAC.2
MECMISNSSRCPCWESEALEVWFAWWVGLVRSAPRNPNFQCKTQKSDFTQKSVLAEAQNEKTQPTCFDWKECFC